MTMDASRENPESIWEVNFGSNVALGVDANPVPCWRECGVVSLAKGWFEDYKYDRIPEAPPAILCPHLSLDEWARVVSGFKECQNKTFPKCPFATILLLVPFFGWLVLLCWHASCFSKCRKAMEQFATELTVARVGGGQLKFEIRLLSPGKESAKVLVLDIQLANMLRVQVPKKYEAGSQITVQTRTGEIQVVPPAGLKSCEWFSVPDPVMMVTVPEGVVAGQAITISTANGPMQVTVPQGVGPGQSFQVQVPAQQVPVAQATPVVQIEKE